ncbi:ROK family transcriptional regulator [Paenibacillus sp. J2TS4]|uniref:ROK family transcriptional regulator n=1 Tax=Paenibacillus sp. J2TS4 TaxID=2807194 RepID=UPI001B1B92D4|nr:ROK family transcriptional regulator [Paenibacillus sp. J2TS4]GIP35393.1 sugar kinase [Paenibacillus sp. J2TS4]
MQTNRNKTASSKLLKSINQQRVLRLIFTEGPISRVELAEKTGLTQQTITNIVNRLLKDDVVQELNPVASNGGRKPVPIMVKSENLYAIGIEVAIRYVRGMLMDFCRRPVKEVIVDVPVYENDEHSVAYIQQVIDELLEHVTNRNQLKGIGCSIQGLVDSKRGVVIYSPGLRWRQFPLQERLEEAYGLPVYLENDANLLALVENLNGRLAGSLNNLTVKLDYGIGGAIVTNGQLSAGATHVAGEFGHYKAFDGEDARLCHCGATGCLTTFASASGLKRNGGYTPAQLLQALEADEPNALKLFGKIEAAVGRAISNVITILNPDHVLLTGKMIDGLGKRLIPALNQRIMETVPESCRDVNLVYLPRTPEESSSAVGLVMNHFFDVPVDRLTL